MRHTIFRSAWFRIVGYDKVNDRTSTTDGKAAKQKTRCRQLWRSMVLEYMKLNLSYPTDILPAISACVMVTFEVTGDQYLAGMWRKSLCRELCWTNRSKTRQRRHVEQLQLGLGPRYRQAKISQPSKWDCGGPSNLYLKMPSGVFIVNQRATTDSED